jgi:hypothetical protein
MAKAITTLLIQAASVVRGAARFAMRLVRPERTIWKRGACTPLHFQSIAHPGACGKTRVMPHNRRPGPEFTEIKERAVRVLLSAYGLGMPMELMP